MNPVQGMKNEHAPAMIINGVTFRIVPCVRCGQIATDEQALKALADWESWFGTRPCCTVCGKPFRMTEVILGHKVFGRHPGTIAWTVSSVVFKEGFGFTGSMGTQVFLHRSCAQAALPQADWSSPEWDYHSEGGREGRALWGDESDDIERPHGP